MKKLLSLGILTLFFAMSILSGTTLPGSRDRGGNESIRNRFVGAWRLAWLEEQGADGRIHRADCTGLLVYTRDGHMSVQVMYRNQQAGSNAAPVQYAQGGYEASFGNYEIDERAHTFIYHVEGALVRTLIGKDLTRVYEFSGKQMIVKSSSPNEHWRVAWEHYEAAAANHWLAGNTDARRIRGKGRAILMPDEGGATMTTWSKDELRKIAEADDLHISPFREDGVTHGTPTWIWSVAVDDALYVRGYNGQKSRWYQAAVRQKAGRITAAGMTKEVTFEPVDGAVNDRIDDAYRAKYKGSPYLSPMIGARARSATVKVMPRDNNA